MAAAAISKKSKNRHILTVVWPISTKFDTVTQFHLLERSDHKNFKNLNIQDGGGRHLEKSKNRHVLAAFWTISIKFGMATHFDTLEPSTVKSLKFWKSKMPAAAILKNRKIALSQTRFDWFRRNLTRWRSFALALMETKIPVTSGKSNLKFRKVELFQYGALLLYTAGTDFVRYYIPLKFSRKTANINVK